MPHVATLQPWEGHHPRDRLKRNTGHDSTPRRNPQDPAAAVDTRHMNNAHALETVPTLTLLKWSRHGDLATRKEARRELHRRYTA